MLSENEKDSRRKFFAETGKTPEEEARGAARSASVFFWLCVAPSVVAVGGLGLFYLLS